MADNTGRAVDPISPEENEALLQKWYGLRNLNARRVDIFSGGLAGDLLLVEGDSIIDHVLSNKSLRLEGISFQLLHAKHILETALKSLQKRVRGLAVVFFDPHRHLLHDGHSPESIPLLDLLRNLLINHMRSIGLRVFSFPDVRSEAWLNFISGNLPEMILFSLRTHSHPSAEFLQMSALFWFCYQGLNVASLDTVEFEESEAIGFVTKAFKPGQDKSPRDPNTNDASKATGTLVDLGQLRRSRDETVRDVLSSLPPLPTTGGAQSENGWLEQCLRLTHSQPTPIDHATRALLYVWVAHQYLLPYIDIDDRAQVAPSLDAQILDHVNNHLYPILIPSLLASVSGVKYTIDIDGHVFGYLVDGVISGASLGDLLGPALSGVVDQAWTASGLPSANLSVLSSTFTRVPNQNATPPRPAIRTLPFEHDVFEAQFPEVAVTSEPASSLSKKASSSVLLDPFAAPMGAQSAPAHRALARAPPPVDERARQKKLKRDQRQMAHLTRQAASLTGAAGAILQQQVIVANPTSTSSRAKPTQAAASSSSTDRAVPAKGKGKAKAPVLSKAEQIRQANSKQKASQAEASSDSWWRNQLEELKKFPEPKQVPMLEQMFRSTKAQEDWLKAEMTLYRLDLVLRSWMNDEDAEESATAERYRVRLLADIKTLSTMKGCTSTIRKSLKTLMKSLGLADIELPKPRDGVAADREPLFAFTKTWKKSKEEPLREYFPITETPIEFQLRAFGEHMDRSMDSKPDTRTSFDPDAWQATVLDKIDQRGSMLVVAPTSAGKTFIGFYAMEKVLRESDDGMLIYVAPTKALVTQVAAEVYARFKKERKGGSCWAVHTREVQLNNALDTQILVTIPEVLFDLYMNPALAKTWLPRIRYVIFDEIHSISEERGTIWTQLILMTQSPVIGLSATIGDAAGFNGWLESVQVAHGHQHSLIMHPHRYSHLRKFVWDSSSSKSPVRFIHPLAPLELRYVNLPADLSLESRDCLALYRAMLKMANSKSLKARLAPLEPNLFFESRATSLLRQKDVLEYEAALKTELNALVRSAHENERDLANETIELLAHGFIGDGTDEEVDAQTQYYMPKESIGTQLVSMLEVLDQQDDLPAILFTFSRNKMDQIAEHLLNSLIAAEEKWRATSPKWKQNVQEWDRWVKTQSKLKPRDAGKSSKRKGGGGAADEDGGRRQDEERGTEAADDGVSRLPPAGIQDPDDPSPEFSYCSFKKYTREELEEDLKELAWSNLPQWVTDCLRRGIALHHAGMPKAYRSLIETLFRVGYIRVMFSTETLALGINAPARTSIFLGDSKWLSPLLYRQCAGRAGRRGFDLLGKVMFIGVPLAKICKLHLAALPPLTGRYPISVTLALQSLRLLEGSQNEAAAKKAIKGILSVPRLTVDTEAGQLETTYLLRFGIDFLRRSKLLDADGTPLTLTPLATMLQEHQPGNLALVSLFGAGYFHTLCKDFEKAANKGEIARTIILILSHLFARRPILKFNKDHLFDHLKRSASVVVLPALPGAARKILDAHNQQVLDSYLGYAYVYATQNEDDMPDATTTPFGQTLEAKESPEDIPIITTLQQRAVRSETRSLFAANSGLGDVYSTVKELCTTARAGIHLQTFMTPYLDLPDKNTRWALNAALYDFFIHGSVAELSRANFIGRGQVWYLLNEFFLVLEAIQTALEQIFKRALRGGGEGGGDEVSGREHVDIDDVKEDAQDLLSGAGGKGVSAAFPEKPPQLPVEDWNVYCAFVSVRVDFEEKFKAMWA
ncbi:P-loop containing nucleoside triphosphate hydrolase protein [Clavulina sp. PMI_390]|nr:P-loop containing nucleoside triphosphate hydrolase protein [Clavulina sp. PMI_390]